VAALIRRASAQTELDVRDRLEVEVLMQRH
jgi:hypothetical protein